jgi:hypothetical protein
MADADIEGLLSMAGALDISTLLGQVDDFARAKPLAILPAAEALLPRAPMASFALLAHCQPSQEADFARIAAAATAAAGAAGLRTCHKYSAWGGNIGGGRMRRMASQASPLSPNPLP